MMSIAIAVVTSWLQEGSAKGLMKIGWLKIAINLVVFVNKLILFISIVLYNFLEIFLNKAFSLFVYLFNQKIWIQIKICWIMNDIGSMNPDPNADSYKIGADPYNKLCF